MIKALAVIQKLGGAAAGIWLIILGDWRVVLAGVALYLLPPVTGIIESAMTPSNWVVPPAIRCAQRGSAAGFIGLMAARSLYVSGLMTVWCCTILYVFMLASLPDVGLGGPKSLIPNLLLSYAIAMSPWAYLASGAARGYETPNAEPDATSVLSAALAELAYMVAALMVASVRATIFEALIAFGGLMLVGWVIQIGRAWQLRREILALGSAGKTG